MGFLKANTDSSCLKKYATRKKDGFCERNGYNSSISQYFTVHDKIRLGEISNAFVTRWFCARMMSIGYCKSQRRQKSPQNCQERAMTIFSESDNYKKSVPDLHFPKFKLFLISTCRRLRGQREIQFSVHLEKDSFTEGKSEQ